MVFFGGGPLFGINTAASFPKWPFPVFPAVSSRPVGVSPLFLVEEAASVLRAPLPPHAPPLPHGRLRAPMLGPFPRHFPLRSSN